LIAAPGCKLLEHWCKWAGIAPTVSYDVKIYMMLDNRIAELAFEIENFVDKNGIT
jgi:hypothetical protein